MNKNVNKILGVIGYNYNAKQESLIDKAKRKLIKISNNNKSNATLIFNPVKNQFSLSDYLPQNSTTKNIYQELLDKLNHNQYRNIDK